MSRAELNIWEDGFRTGWIQCSEQRRQDADAEAEQLFRRATYVVRVMAGIDPYEERQARATGRA